MPRPRSRPPRRHPRGDKGSATIEVAIVMPLVMLLLMLVVQAGLYFHTRAVATTAAHKGVDTLRVEHGTGPTATGATEKFLDRHAPALQDRNVTAHRRGDEAEVTVTGDVMSVLFGIDLFPVQVTANAPIEQVTP